MIPTHNTRLGAEDVAHFALENPGSRIALVARTFADGRDTMVEGDSGLLSILPESCLRGGSRDTAWNRSLGELILENGSRFDIFSSQKPDQLRGPQFHRAWCDETAAWLDAFQGDVQSTTWNNLLLALRLGADPKCVVTTTPKNVKLIRDMTKDPLVVTTVGSTHENLDNLAPTFRERILRYEGTRLGDQELHGLLIEDAEGALWKRAVIERGRVPRLGGAVFQRVAVAVDPAGGHKPGSADTGIVGGGLTRGGCPWCGTKEDHVFILEDRTCHEAPEEWARRAVKLYDDLEADALVVEVNHGSDLVAANIRTARRNLPIREVRASRGKAVRAEPVAAVYARAQGPMVHHVGGLPDLESQLCTWEPDSGDSPDRLDALVWLVWHLLSLGEDDWEAPVAAPRGERQVSGWRAA